MALSITQNSLQTREDLIHLITELYHPLEKYYTKGKTRLNLGSSSAHFGLDIAGMEGFSRLLWGMVPLAAGGEETELWNVHLEGIKNGTNPDHEEYWGDINGIDQRMVEMAAFGLALALVPDKVWAPLNDEEKDNLYQWLDQINQYEVVENNWQFFRILVNTGFHSVGLPVNHARQEESFEKIESYYQGDGWYADGHAQQWDYYISFAFHYYGLIYAELMKKADPERSGLYKQRASMFARDFMYWFAADGSALPFGRSLTYRFAQVSFWSAYIYAGLEDISMGVCKGLIFRHLRWWMKQPIFTEDGVLTIGYGYPNLIMAENYNSPGSPYWAMKTFLVLALRAGHPFWQVEEKPLPKLDKIKKLPHPRMVITREDDQQHVYALVSGQYSDTEHAHNESKYAKFAYSTHFGFHVPKGIYGEKQGAFDSMLAFSEKDTYYRVRRRCETMEWQDSALYSRWKPWTDVEVKTWLIPMGMWHVRIHHIYTERELDTVEGAFSVPLEQRPTKPKSEITPHVESFEEYGIGVCLDTGTSAIYDLTKKRIAKLVETDPNTNLLYASPALLPSLTHSLPAGDQPVHLVTAVFASSKTRDPLNHMIPEWVQTAENEAELWQGSGRIGVLRDNKWFDR
ncbi:DUF2264 domain-containing protein [Salibacterium aidingense]|uniref:DUF2264 domain-containing protein n=1 Tax=Salibacterium aidingense TaxID=384933 RepID=UPI0004297313|nr:DUF2264 domain-containing protein [Salibacterium aidingense]